MAFVNFNGATRAVRLDDPKLAEFALSSTGGTTGWTWLSSGGDEIATIGRGFEFVGVQPLVTAGRVERIRIDVDNDSAAADVEISGASFAATLLDDGSQAFWNAVLGGNDIIDARGLAATRIGAGTISTLFGDDSSATGGVGGTNRGGNDVITLGDGGYIVAGDIHLLEGLPGGATVTYQAGRDQILAQSTASFQQLAGDASSVFARATLLGGDDLLSVGGRNSALAAGDASLATGIRNGEARVEGGDDRIEAKAGTVGTLSGDVHQALVFADVIGGDDSITDSDSGNQLFGDVSLSTGGSANFIIAGDDRISGNGGDDLLSGDVGTRTGQTKVTAGDDTLFGGAGNDALFGEVATGSLVGATGGNDEMFGDEGDDRLFGQTGNDRLDGGSGRDRLDGGAGKDRLDGGAGDDDLRGGGGADVFIFGPLSGRDRVLDFEDGKDKFDVAPDARFSDLRIKAVDAEGNGQVNDVSVVLFQQTFVVLNRAASAIDASDFLF